MTDRTMQTDPMQHHTSEPVAQSGPIFIGGTSRSGKTWMRFMLSSHPNLAVSRRTNLWTRHAGRYGDLSQDANLDRCLNALLRSKHVRLLNPDPQLLRREFRQGPATYARLFALLHEHYAHALDKARWGDQSEGIEACAERIFAAYPNAKLIHMVRDPRDSYEAIRTRTAEGAASRRGIGGATAAWRDSVRLAQRNVRQYPEHCLIVQYETLMLRPEETLRDVCAFIGEAFDPAMLAMDDVPRFQATTAPGQSPLSTAYIGRYRQALAPREIAFIQLYAGCELDAYGYQLETLRLSAPERLSFWLADWPANRLRAVAWRRLATGPASGGAA